MRPLKYVSGFVVFVIFISFNACTTDPIGSPNNTQTDPPIQDPGTDNLCDPGVISFQHQVLPIMISSCAYSGCHDAVSAKDGIVLTNYDNVRKEVKPGDPNDSELYESITENDPDDIMPPPPAAPLTTEQITIIREWINQGAENTTCGAPCDSTATSFSTDIFPLLQNHCVGCHNSTRSDGNVNLENYGRVIPYVQNGSLLGTIKHDALYPVMPPSGSKLSDCRIAQVRKWIEEGAKDN